MNLWLDDVRPPPDEGWHWVKTAAEAIACLRSRRVMQASLDYDILWSPPYDPECWADRQTGYAVVAWMAENDVWPVHGVEVHSSNAEGAARMRKVIDAHYCGWKRYCGWRFPPNPDVRRLEQARQFYECGTAFDPGGMEDGYSPD